MVAARRSRREELVEAVAHEEVRLARLETEQAEGRSRLAALQAELAALGAEPESRVRLLLPAEASVPKTPVDKVKLFRSLFRGREDRRRSNRAARPVGDRDAQP